VKALHTAPAQMHARHEQQYCSATLAQGGGLAILCALWRLA
jgi:hypothetical protein